MAFLKPCTKEHTRTPQRLQARAAYLEAHRLSSKGESGAEDGERLRRRNTAVVVSRCQPRPQSLALKSFVSTYNTALNEQQFLCLPGADHCRHDEAGEERRLWSALEPLLRLLSRMMEWIHLLTTASTVLRPLGQEGSLSSLPLRLSAL